MQTAAISSSSSHWWDFAAGGTNAYGEQVDEDDNQLAEAIWQQVDYLGEQARTRRVIDRIHSTLYSNKHSYSGKLKEALTVAQAGGGPIRLNVTRSTVDTLTSRISKNLALVKVVADGAKWTMKRRARRLSRFVTAKLKETEFQRLAPLVFRDAAIKGTGIVLVTSKDGEVVYERVPKHEIYVDEREAKYGKPRTIHRKKQYAKEDLAALFEDPEVKHSIQMAYVDTEDDALTDEANEYDPADLVDVVVSHHLPDANGENGWRVVTVKGEVLEKTPWVRPSFPYVFFHFSPPEEGFWGTGLVEELASIQWSIDSTINILEEGFRLGAPLKVFVPRGSRIIKTQLNNRIGAVIEFSGTRAPEIKAPSNPVSQQQINWLMQLYQWAYEISGISLMSATAQKPGGIESGVALRTLHDFETVRFAALELAYQTMFVDIAERIIWEAKEIYAERDPANDNVPEDKRSKDKEGRRYPNYSAKWVHRDVLQTIKWKDVAIDPRQFKLQLQPTNFVSGTSAAQMERVIELAGSSLVPPHWLLSLLENPDLERFYRLQSAQWSYIEYVAERLMDEDKPMPQPRSEANLDLLQEHITAALLDCVTDEAPASVLKRLTNFLGVVSAKMQQKIVAPPAPMAGPPGAPPPMGPGGMPLPEGGPPPMAGDPAALLGAA